MKTSRQKTGARLLLAAVIASALVGASVRADPSFTENFASYPNNTELLKAPDGKSQIVSDGPEGWKAIWWSDVSEPPQFRVGGENFGWTWPAFPDDGSNGNFLIITAINTNVVLYNISAGELGGASTISVDVFNSKSPQAYRGLVFNLKESLDGQTYYYVGMSRLENGNIGLTIRKSVDHHDGFNFADYSDEPRGWDRVFEQNKDTGLPWTEGNWDRLTVSLTKPGVFSVLIQEWNTGPTEVKKNTGSEGKTFKSEVVDDASDALKGGYAGIATSMWDAIGFNNFSIATGAGQQTAGAQKPNPAPAKGSR
jgi:hypothetical protein